jgi:hypothetical protein
MDIYIRFFNDYVRFQRFGSIIDMNTTNKILFDVFNKIEHSKYETIILEVFWSPPFLLGLCFNITCFKCVKLIVTTHCSTYWLKD